MLDLETWGTQPYSTIIAIGACVFDPYVSAPDNIIVDQFEVAIDPESCQGMRIDPATMMWWLDPEREVAREAWRLMLKVSLPEALDGFSDWLNSHGPDVRIWGNGAGFDNTLLRQAYEVMKRDAPWNFRHDRCFRTLRSMLSEPLKQVTHSALTDAVDQAMRVNLIVRNLGIKLT